MYPNSQGEFKRTDQFFRGQPVFENNNGQYLQICDEFGWAVSEKFPSYPDYEIVGTPIYNCPAKSRNWLYKNDSGAQTTSVVVRCSTHN